MGARYIELKTVQTLDELEVTKPCIEMSDEGYNCEWSQELKIHQSFDEYLNAWIIIHLLKDKFGWHNDEAGFIFILSVGYNLEGIKKPNVQWFFDKMNDCSDTDANCPSVLGVEARFPIRYDDPKKCDDAELEAAKYDERFEEIGKEMLFVFQMVNKMRSEQ